MTESSHRGEAGGEPGRPPLWGNREYRLWLTGDILLDLGGYIGMFAFPLIALAVTGTTAGAGTVALFQGIGTFLAILPGGLIADRFDRRRTRLLSNALGILAQAMLVLLLLTASASVLTLSIIATLDRFRGTLLAPSSDAMIKQVVPEERLADAVAVNQGRSAAVQLGGGPLGGLLLGIALIAPPVGQIVGQIGSFLSTLTMRGDYRPRSDGASARKPLQELREGLAWVGSRPMLLALGLSLALLNFGVSGVVMTITLGLGAQGLDPVLISLVLTAYAAAMLLGSFVAGRLVERVRVGVIAVAAYTVLVAFAMVVPLLPDVRWIIGAAFFAGLLIPAVNAGLFGFFTLVVPNVLLGRVSSVMTMLSVGLGVFAPAVAGWGLTLAGSRATMFGFAAAVTVSLGVLLSSRRVRAIPASGDWKDYALAEGMIDGDQR